MAFSMHSVRGSRTAEEVRGSGSNRPEGRGGWGGGREGWKDFYQNCTLGYKAYFLRSFHDRSASFFGQKSEEHVKTIKKHNRQTHNYYF